MNVAAFSGTLIGGATVGGIAAKTQRAQQDQYDQQDTRDGRGIFTFAFGGTGGLALAHRFFLVAQNQRLHSMECPEGQKFLYSL